MDDLTALLEAEKEAEIACRKHSLEIALERVRRLQAEIEALTQAEMKQKDSLLGKERQSSDVKRACAEGRM